MTTPITHPTDRRPRPVYHVRLPRRRPTAKTAKTRRFAGVEKAGAGCMAFFAALVLAGLLAFCGLFGAVALLIVSNF